MSFFEKLILALLAALAQNLPVLIHSKQGIAVFNASEELLNAMPSAIEKHANQTPSAA